MPDWNPTLYTRFEEERTRPAKDLLLRVRNVDPTEIVDLGCGPGNSTELLVDRFPSARILGLDSSPAMVQAARSRLPALDFEQADVATWVPARPVDVIFANAVLQWLPDHASLVPKLFAMLRPGGTLAIQMPDNLDEPSHRAMRTVAGESPWSDRLRSAAAQRTALPPLTAYYNMLCANAASVDVWRTSYQHPMESPAAIVEWVRATGLRAFLERLGPGEEGAFLARYEALLADAYPAQADGWRLLAFPRIFIVAQRAG